MIVNNVRQNPCQKTVRDNLFFTLNELCARSRNNLMEKSVDLEDVKYLSSCVTTMRMLLSELVHVEDRLGRDDRMVAEAKELKERFFELEGLAKEVRNNLDHHDRRTNGGPVPDPLIACQRRRNEL